MKIEVLSRGIVCSNEESLHKYFGWPTVGRLKDGKLAVVGSGFRLAHIDPFGKCIITYSEDEGKTWSLPAVLIDTPLDDRDGGICAFGESSLIVTSFNLDIARQRQEMENWWDESLRFADTDQYFRAYWKANLDLVEQKYDEKQYFGYNYRISHDNGKTFGPRKQAPVSNPHGPVELPDGSLFFVGNKPDAMGRYVSCYKLYPEEDRWEFLCDLDEITDHTGLTSSDPLLSYEPHAICTKSGKIIVHIRTQTANWQVYTIYQSESYDGGKTFTKPHRISGQKSGAPAHLLEHDGMLISVYGHRDSPFGIWAMFSRDDGETWDTENVVTDDGISGDMGYCSSVVLNDGTIMTVDYGRLPGMSAPVLHQTIWKYTEA